MQDKISWSKSTTYSSSNDSGAICRKNEDATVTSLVSKKDVQAAELDELVNKTFEGSISAFINTFSRRQDLSQDEIMELRRMIDTFGDE